MLFFGLDKLLSFPGSTPCCPSPCTLSSFQNPGKHKHPSRLRRYRKARMLAVLQRTRCLSPRGEQGKHCLLSVHRLPLIPPPGQMAAKHSHTPQYTLLLHSVSLLRESKSEFMWFGVYSTRREAWNTETSDSGQTAAYITLKREELPHALFGGFMV